MTCLCLSADGKVYAMGGMGLDTAPQALVRIYDAAKDHWQPLTSMPTPRYGATPFMRGNKIILMGMNQIFPDSIVCLNVLSRDWSVLAKLAGGSCCGRRMKHTGGYIPLRSQLEH